MCVCVSLVWRLERLVLLLLLLLLLLARGNTTPRMVHHVNGNHSLSSSVSFGNIEEESPPRRRQRRQRRRRIERDQHYSAGQDSLPRPTGPLCTCTSRDARRTRTRARLRRDDLHRTKSDTNRNCTLLYPLIASMERHHKKNVVATLRHVKTRNDHTPVLHSYPWTRIILIPTLVLSFVVASCHAFRGQSLSSSLWTLRRQQQRTVNPTWVPQRHGYVSNNRPNPADSGLVATSQS